MTTKTIDKNGLLLILSSLFLFSCSSHAPIQKLVDKKVAVASGVDFDTAKTVALDPETGEEISPCIQPGDAKPDGPSAEKSGSSSTKATEAVSKCTVELLVDNNPALRTALELSKKPIQGEIKKDGKLKPARFVVTVTSLYEGSHCNVVYSGGDQIENCSKHSR